MLLLPFFKATLVERGPASSALAALDAVVLLL
jgi:hypothetical protein